MSGSVVGGKKAAHTTRQRHGADFYRRIAAIGGSRKVAKGFAMMEPEKHRAISKIGGQISRRKGA